jgi:hypothetical protein
MYMSVRLARLVACTVMILGLAAGCGEGKQTSMQPELTTKQLAGTWVSPEGAGTITLYADHNFVATRLDLNGYLGASCQPTASASGTWQFLGSNGDPGPNMTTYSSGYVISLTVPGFTDYPQSSCVSVWGLLQFTSWQINGPLGLCLYQDPDSPCAGEPWVWQKAARRG